MDRPPNDTGTWGLLETLALGAAVAMAAGTAVMWATAELAGRIFGGGSPNLTAGQALNALTSWPSVADHPRVAYPVAARHIPDDTLYLYLSLGVVVVSVAAVLAGVVLAVRRTRPDGDGARVAGRRDLRGLVRRNPVPGRLTLGRTGRRLVVAEERHSLLVIGPPQTGKTTGLAIPAILEWPGPVIVTSSKTDVHEDTHRVRSRRGEVMIYDPTGRPDRSVTWTPLGAVTDWASAQTVARALMSAHGGTTGVDQANFWQSSAEMMLAPILRAAAHQGGMTAVITWLDAGPAADTQIADLLADLNDPLAASAWGAVEAMEPRTRASVTATGRTILAGWWDPRVLALAEPGLTADCFLTGTNTLYLVAPAHHQDRLKSIFAGIVSELTRAVFEHRAHTGSRLDPGLLVVLDEAAHIAPVRNLPELAATGAEPGIQLVSIFHDAAQIRAAYGDRAPTVISNHRARLYLPGIGDADTLTHLSRSLGETEVTRQHTSHGPAGRTSTETTTGQPLMTADELRRMPDGEALLVYGTRRPARIRLRPWYRDRRLRRLAAGR